jgi:hypothetical protein
MFEDKIEKACLWSTPKLQKVLPNVVVKWLPLLLRIRQVPDSNLGLGDQLF